MSKIRTLKLKGGIRKFFLLLNILAVVLIGINIGVIFLNKPAALLMLLFTIPYLATLTYAALKNRTIILNEMVSFATQYGQVQRRLLRDLNLPYALLDETGKVVWTNTAFKEAFGVGRDFKKSLTSLFPTVHPEDLPTEDGEDADNNVNVEYESRTYRISMRRISMSDMISDSDIVDASDAYSGYLTACFFYDNTALKIALKEIDDQSLAVGLIYLDNYEEALESVEEVRRSLLIALIDRKINKYISALDGICKKIEKDKFLVIMRKQSLETLKESKFDLLQDVKTVNIGNEMAVTLSMGIGLDGLSYAQNYEFARNAIDMALGRGGDQAVVKTLTD